MPSSSFARVDGLSDFLAERGHKNAPQNMLGYDQNCVAMALSRCLGVGAYPTINFFIRKGWIDKASDLENDTKYENVLSGLEMAKLYDYHDWAEVKIGMRGQPDGRYFCINVQHNKKGGNGHAFAIVKKGGVGVVGNNQDKTSRPYLAAITDGHKITVWGPIRTP